MDTTNTLLFLIAQQLTNSSAAQVLNPEPLGSIFFPSSSDVRINILYFLSLTLALSVSSVSILGKQWIREYQKDTPGSSCDAIRVRQARFDAFNAWKVPHILATLPVILLCALLLFFAGLLEQLWHVNNHSTAGVVSVVITLTFVMVVLTTIIPAHWSHKKFEKKFTPFRSPQAWLYFVVFQCAKTSLEGSTIYQAYQGFLVKTFNIWSCKPMKPVQSWSGFDVAFLEEENDHFRHRLTFLDVTSAHRALRWAFTVFKNATNVEKAVFWCFQSQHHPWYLVRSEQQIGLYVHSGETDAPLEYTDDLDRIYYRLSCTIDQCNIRHVRGRFQVELLLRSANRAIDALSTNGTSVRSSDDAWNVISGSCCELQSHFRGVFDPAFEEISDGKTCDHISKTLSHTPLL